MKEGTEQQFYLWDCCIFKQMPLIQLSLGNHDLDGSSGDKCHFENDAVAPWGAAAADVTAEKSLMLLKWSERLEYNYHL